MARGVQVNDLIMVLAFAPLVGLLLGLSAIVVPWATLMLSVVLYIVIPVVAAQIIRRRVLAQAGEAGLNRLLALSRFRSWRSLARWYCSSGFRVSRSCVSRW